MKTLLFQVLGLCFLFLAGPAMAQVKDKAATEESARQRIIRNAPIVFLGRPLQGENYKDASGRIYQSTVIQVLEVLRGDQALKAGTVEFVDSLVQTPELEALYRFGGTSVNERDYGVYFATPSTYPAKTVPYQTTNGKLQVKAFRNDPQAKVLVNYGSHGSIIEGLYRWWDSEASMLDYINKLPQMRPVAKLGNQKNYPFLYYHDKRLGGHDVFSPSIPVESQLPAAKDNLAAPAAPDTESAAAGPTSSNSLPLDAFKQLPAVMQRIRTNQPLSKQDSIFIKTYLPDYGLG